MPWPHWQVEATFPLSPLLLSTPSLSHEEDIKACSPFLEQYAPSFFIGCNDQMIEWTTLFITLQLVLSPVRQVSATISTKTNWSCTKWPSESLHLAKEMQSFEVKGKWESSGKGIYCNCPEFTSRLEWRHNWIFLLACNSNKNFVDPQKVNT